MINESHDMAGQLKIDNDIIFSNLYPSTSQSTESTPMQIPKITTQPNSQENSDIFNSNDDPVEEWQVDIFEGSDLGEKFTIPSNFRVWESKVRKGCSAQTETSPFRFKILSYNVLAQYLIKINPNAYSNCAPDDLKWKIRSSRLYDEIISYDPDILCLQEVQASHVKSFYSKFEKIGYCGVFKQKTGFCQDGCAIYFKTSVFKMKDHISVEFNQPELPILNRDHIGIMVKLTPRDLQDTTVVVATTHLINDTRRMDVKLAQMQLFLAEIDRFAYYNDGWESGYVPIILAGDFNSKPNSVVVKLLDNGKVYATGFRDTSDWTRILVTDRCQHYAEYLNRKPRKKGTKIFQNIHIHHSEFPQSCGKLLRPKGKFKRRFNQDVLRHALNLTSAYDKFMEEESEDTAYQSYRFPIDYIYYNRCRLLRLVSRLRLPTSGKYSMIGHLPNRVYGSDHFALGAVFELLPTHPHWSKFY